MSRNIFFVGPASVGKTTVGKLVATKLGYHFVDIDQEFCQRVENIGTYLQTRGYVEYCEANSKLAHDLVKEYPTSTVFATPSGFLVHEECPHLVERHLMVIKNGISVLLLPSRDPLAVADMIAERQLARWPDVGLTLEKERQKFLDRFEKYKNYGDIQIFSPEDPEVMADTIYAKLLEHENIY